MTAPTFFRPANGTKFHELRADGLAWCGFPERRASERLFGIEWRSTLEQEDELCRKCMQRKRGPR